MSAAHTEGRLLAGRAYFSGENYTPKISAGDTARVLCFLNISGAYNGYARLPQADADARRIAACWNACQGLTTDEVELHAEQRGVPFVETVAAYWREQQHVADISELLDLLARHHNEDGGELSMPLRIATRELLHKHGRT